jgi:hypothetical protein
MIVTMHAAAADHDSDGDDDDDDHDDDADDGARVVAAAVKTPTRHGNIVRVQIWVASPNILRPVRLRFSIKCMQKRIVSAT